MEHLPPISSLYLPKQSPDGRILRDWVKAYGRYTHDSESPDSFHLWTAFWTIAGAVRRKVALPFGHGFIFANIYAVLVAPPGRVKKTHAMKIGARMLDKIGMPLVASSTTREALIKYAESVEEMYAMPDGECRWHNSLSLASDEFATFLGENNFAMISLLTDWFDCAENWRYETKGSGSNTINALWFNMMACSTPESIASFLPSHAFGGGFTARIIFVVERNPRKKIALPSSPEDDPELMALGKALIHDLSIMANLSGRFCLTPEAKDFYVDWYNSEDRNKGIENERMLVYLERKPIHALKLAMVRHISRSSELIIELSDIQQAIALLDGLEPMMPDAFSGVGGNRFAGIQARIYHYISRFEKGVSNSELLRMFWQDLNTTELDGILTTLRDMGSISVHPLNSEEWYKSVPESAKNRAK